MLPMTAVLNFNNFHLCMCACVYVVRMCMAVLEQGGWLHTVGGCLIRMVTLVGAF